VNSTVSGNRAGGFGQNNFPGRGGGISADGTLTISNSTISGNSAWGNDFKGPGYGGVSLALASRSIIAPSVATLLRSAAAFPLAVASKSETRS
jgi:predicted outer membrane repeat protein